MQQDKLFTIEELCKVGATFQDIGSKLGVSRQAVHKLLKKYPELNALRVKVREEGRQGKMEELVREKTRKYRGLTKQEFYADALRAEQNYRLKQKKANASSAGIEFDLTWFDLEWPTMCPILHLEIDYFCEAGGRNERSCSFDRIDPRKGYVKGNVVVMSWRANRIKNDGNAWEHRKIAEWLDSHDVEW